MVKRVNPLVDISKIRRNLVKIRAALLFWAKTKQLQNPIQTLECFCGISSYIIFKYLESIGYKPKFHMMEVHCFVTFQHETGLYYVDITLQQFDIKQPKVYLCRRPVKLRTYVQDFQVHVPDKSTQSHRTIKSYFKCWPNEQNPFYHGWTELLLLKR